MIITLNGTLRLNDEAVSGYLINGRITGLGPVKRRVSSGVRSDRDGGYVGAHRNGMRNISIPIMTYGFNAVEHEARKAALFAAIASGEVTVQIQTNSGALYTTETVVVDPDFPYDPNPLKTEGNLELLAPDSVLYDDSVDGMLTATLSRASGGGLTWPLTWPLSWAPGTAPTNIVNSGLVDVRPVITLTGSMTNPIITNVTTGKVFKLTPLVTSVSDEVVVDLKNYTVTLNDGPILNLMSLDSSWLELVKGTNKLILTTSSSSDTVAGLVEWKPGVMGI